MTIRATPDYKPNFSVNIRRHHALCEMNFHRLLKLITSFHEDESRCVFKVGVKTGLTIEVSIVDRARYTTTIEIIQHQEQIKTPRLLVRLYHDADMAEVVALDNHRNWHPQYAYPNANMYHPDEKLAINQFLGDWLTFCRHQGLFPVKNCDEVLVMQNNSR